MVLRKSSLIVLTIIALAVVSILIIPNTANRAARFDTIQVKGDGRFQRQVTNALALLKTRSPESYAIVTNCIGVIVRSKHSGMAAYENPPTFELNDRTAFESLTWCAGSIAHDSIHSKLFLEYRKAHPGTDVPDDAWGGEAVERRCCEHQTRVLQELGAPVSEISWSAQTTNRYWEVDYNKRDW